MAWAAARGVLVLGATNNPGVLDEAILRSGRMDRLIEILPPDAEALEGILRHHLKGDLPAEDLLPAARPRSRRNWRRLRPLDKDGTADGPRARASYDGRGSSDRDRRHRAIARNRGPGSRRTRRGMRLQPGICSPGKSSEPAWANGGDIDAGVSFHKRVLTTREAIEGELLVLMAGRAAEEVLLGNFSGGCGGSYTSDLSTATCLALALEASLGLGSAGPIFLGLSTPENSGPMLAHHPALAAKITADLGAVYVQAVDFVRKYRDATAAVARALEAARSLTGVEIARIVGDHPAMEAISP